MIQDFAELVSLALTVPTIVLSVWVCRLFFRQARNALFTTMPRSAVQWIAMGITIGFFGGAIDNLYWSIPWTASYLDLESTNDLVKAGVYFNIPFRQVCDIAAAYCHIRAAVDYVKHQPKKKDLDHVNHILNLSLLLGIVFAGLLWWFR